MMDMQTYRSYVDAIPMITAKEQLERIEIIKFPKLKENKDREAIIRKYRKMKNNDPEVYDSPKDIARMLNNGR